MTYSKSSKKEKGVIQNPATERMSYSKSSKKEKGVTQNPARKRKELFKIQQERERSYSKSSKRQTGSILGRDAELEQVMEKDDEPFNDGTVCLRGEEGDEIWVNVMSTKRLKSM